MNRPPSDEWIVTRLLELPVAERSAFLKRVADGDSALLARLQKIAASINADPVAAAPTPPSGDALASALEFALRAETWEGEVPGTFIGPYKLLQRLGEGGFGVVWMAEQGEPLRRRVALKIVKTGMDTHEVVARFEAERQALALMDHPNIARVFDAGVTASGRPYFVMELVRGVGITRYCDENRLTTDARLKLFEAVCLGIQHAHQKGVIHRDLKPSNVLVTLHDGVPVPKIIDFGVAKATGGARLTEKTLCTQFHAFVGTPVYTSPEQMEMSGLDVDTRSDIYSLGVLLYELLAGRPPFDPNELAESGLEAMRRTIRDIDPPRPSHRLHTLPDAERTTVARQRSTDVARLVTSLHGDLDSIVMRCLEKDRTRRYDTAGALAADVERHLRSEPVVARPPSAAYRARKFVRRHRVGVSAIAAVFVTLLAGLATSSALFVRERSARERAVASERAQTQLWRKADAARAAETIRVSRAARDLGWQMLAQGHAAEGLAWLVHAARTDPTDGTIAPRLASVLASRKFLLPQGPTLRFAAPISNVHYISGGSRIAVFAEDGTVGIVDRATGVATKTKLPSGLAQLGVVSVGAVTVVLGDDSVLRVLETTTAEVLREFSFGQKVLLASATRADPPDVLVVLEDRSLVIAETGTNRVRTPPIKIAPTDGLAWSDDGRWLAIFQPPGREGRWWDTLAGVSSPLRVPGRRALTTHVSPDNSRVVEIYVADDGQLVFSIVELPRDAGRWTGPKALPEHPPRSAQMHVRFSPDGRVFAIGSQYGTQLFSSATGEKVGPFVETGLLMTTFKGEERRNRFGILAAHLAFRGPLFRQTAAGLQTITPSILDMPMELTLRDAATGQPVLPSLKHEAGIIDARLSEDGGTLLALAADESVLLWDLNTGELRAEPTRLGVWKDMDVAISPDGSELAVGGPDGTFRRLRAVQAVVQPLSLPRATPMPASFSTDVPGRLLWFRNDRLRVVDLGAAAVKVGSISFPEPILSLGSSQTGIALRRDGRYAVVQTASGRLEAWEIAESEIKRVIPLETSPATALWSAFFSPHRDLLAIVFVSAGEPIRVWDLNTGQPIGRPFVHGDRVPVGNFQRCVCFSPDGQRLVVAGTRGTVRICEIATGKVVAEFALTPPTGCTCVDVSRDGTRIVTGHGDFGVQLWDGASLKKIGPRLAGGFARFSDSGRELLTWGAGTARVWNARTGEPLSVPMSDLTVGTRDAEFSRDGHFVATVGMGSAAKVWDARSGEPISARMVHQSRVVSTVFSPDGRLLLTEEAGKRGVLTTFHVWPVPPHAGDSPAPEWLLRLATMWARKRIDDAGRCVDAPEAIDEFEHVRREVLRLPATDPFAEWGRWLVEARADRSIAPGLAMTAAQAEEIAAELNR